MDNVQLSDKAQALYNAMKKAGVVGEEKMKTADQIAAIGKMPKNQALQALEELQNKKLLKRKAREKAAGYYLLE